MRGRVVVLAVAVVSVPTFAFAAAERTWSPLVRGQVPAGEPHGAAPTSRGTIAIAPDAKELAAPPAPYLWSLAVRGGKVFAGSGDGGEIWEVPETGAAAKAIHDPPELQAQTLAVSGDALLAGLNPGARVVSLHGSVVDTLFKAPSSEQYVWSILPAKDGSLHVAVGSPGRVYLVKPGRSTPPTIELESGDGAVRSLAWGKDGKLLAGTDGRGLVMRVDGDGKKFVLFDAPRREISSISVAEDGTIWFAAIGQEEAEASPTPAPAVPALPTPAPTPADPKKGLPGLLYKMRPDGFAELVWTAPGPSISSVLARGDGTWVATGDPGAVWRIDAAGVSQRIHDPSAGQATALIADGKDVLEATANPSKVFRLAPARRGPASFEGSPLDAGGFAHWGRLAWESAGAADAKVEVDTRSGNTATPDGSWSSWSAGIPQSGGEVGSPAARYLQWRVQMAATGKSPAPELTGIDLIYRVENRAPRVDAVNVFDPGVTLAPKADALLPGYALPPDQRPTAVRKPLPPKPGYQRGWRAASWAASDPDGDELVYDVYLRGAGESGWIPLAHAIPENYVTWDATGFPDGKYELRVVARDDASNGAGASLSGERIAGPFDIDSTPPKVEGLSVRREGASLAVSFSATDGGIVAGATVSVDGGDPVPLVAADGLADSPSERFEAKIPAPPPGEHLVVVRVVDRAGNPASAKVVLK